MRSLIRDVHEFMVAAEQEVPARPTIPGGQVVTLRDQLIDEEFKEYREAVLTLLVAYKNGDDLTPQFAAVADALADLHYVVAGAGIAFGLPMVEIWDEVQRANMDKFMRSGDSWVSLKREDGKIIKPPTWSPPNIEPIIGRALNADQKGSD